MASDGEISCTNDPNFAVIYSFLKVFGKLYGLDIPTITKLQELVENTQEVLDPLKELHLRLLRRALKSVQSNRWERGLIKFCHQQGSHQEAWEIERFSYKKASTQVKLKVLKMLLEYQFTCHPKFKTAVNAVSCKDLRLDPVGRDRSGCVYWLQVDHEANLCLYREDQDEETWQLIARNREQLVKVIAQLKSGEDVCPPVETNTNEDSNSAEIPPQLEPKLAAEEENEEEFLSPESESEHEEDQESNKVPSNTTEPEKSEDSVPDHKEEKEKDINPITEEKTDNLIEKVNSPKDDKPKSPKTEETLTSSNEKPSSPGSLNNDRPLSPDNKLLMNSNNDTTDASCEEQPTNSPSDKPHSPNEPNHDSPKEDQKEIEETQEAVSEAIEEPLMIVTGEGNGADCESAYILGEEIMEPVMFFYGEGCGYDNDTGNPEVIERENEVENTDEENGNEECLNGENHEISNSSKAKSVKGVKLKSKLPSVTKRTLKKQSTDTSETLKPDTKKPCVRNLDKSDSSNANSKGSDRELKRESSVNDKTTTDSESPNKNHIKKGRNKVKKKPEVTRKLKIKEKKVLNSVVETDNGHDSKTSIIEKRKSSLSSDDQDDEHTENEKDKSSDKELKEDTLPPKKLRLETTPESDTVSHSKETLNATEVVNNSDDKKSSNDIATTNKVDNNPISQRKKIKAKKGKFKRKLIQKNESTLNKFDKEEKANGDKKEDRTTKNKSLKRSLLDATLSDKNKSESQSESEDDEPVTSGKRIKIKPKKIIKSSRKKVEAKLQEKHSSDESEEETLYSIAGKKATKKVLKKKPKTMKQKEKSKSTKSGSESDVAPVRQSRRIAQLKIREEAERRHLEEVALRELKMIHKKKNKDEEEDWQASEHSESDWDRRARKKPAAWRASDSTGPEPDSESDEPLFEHPEPDLEFGKSDHEFSPESDLECDEPVEPLKRARTLQEEKDDGFCKRCGSGEQPEWILLCDKCDAGYHASCLKPVLFLVPEGDWYCPPCNHDMLIASLEGELVKYDELFAIVEAERERRRLEEPEKPLEEIHEQKDEKEKSSEEASSDWSSSSSSEGAVYRLRARRQLPVSYRAQEYDRLISSAIKEEYVEPTTSAGNQGRGKDISTIIEAAEEEKLKAEREALEQGKPVEVKKVKKKQRRKPRKLNSLDVPSEDDDETDEDFKDTGMESSSEEISSSAEKDSSTHSGSSDDLPIRRACRPEKKDRPKLVESSPEVKKKKKGVFDDSSSESGENKEWSKKSKSKSKMKKREKSSSKKSRRRGHGSLTQYDAEGNVIRARVTYGGLSDDENDWSPKHRTRQKKINYTEMPNTESEDEMHKSSGKHMPDSSDEFKIDDSDVTSDSDTDRVKRKREEESDEKKRALDDLITKTAVVPLEKLPDDVTKAKTEELQAHLDAQAAAGSRPLRGKGSRGGRGSRGPRGSRGGRGGLRGSPGASDDALAKLVGVKIKDLKPDGTPRPHDAEREKKRQEREAKQAEKEAKKLERLQKKEEKEKLKEQKAKEREEKRLARLALQESKRMKKEKPEYAMPAPMGYMPRPMGPEGPRMAYPGTHPGEYNQQPRLQVRAELRGVLTGEDRLTHGHRPDGPPGAMREGTLSVAGSPQPFKPITEEPSIITRMPHMINQQYRSPMMNPNPNSGYGPRGPQNMMYGMAHGGPRQYPPQYYAHLRLPYQQPLRAAHPPASPGAPAMHPPPAGMHARPGSGGPPPAGHMPPVSGPPSAVPHGSPGAMQQGPHGPLGAGHQLGLPGRAGSSPHGVPPHGAAGPSHAPPVSIAGMSPHAPPGAMSHGYPRHVNPLGHPGSPAPHGQMGPRGPPHYGPAGQPPPPRPPGPTPPPAASPAATAPGGDAPVQIKTEVKTEVKTEPEYRSPPGSPRDDAPRHPKIKHTENKDRRPRYPLGPYAPYGPYGPYAPVTAPQDMSTLLNLQARLNPQAQSPLQRMHQIHQFLPTSHADGRPSDMASPLRPHLERPPLHIERPQLNMERPPLHMERPPIHMERPQLHHMERPPLHAERPPLHMERPMLHAQRPPLHMERSPFHMERPPLHAERPPGHMERPPGHMERPPGHMERPPGHMERPPSHNMERPPGHMERPPSHMERPPSHNMERPPGHMERPPSHNMERPPSHIDRSSLHTERPPERPPSHPAQSPTLADRMERPTNMERSPAQLDRPPAHMDRTSAHMNRPPGHMERQPEHMDRPPTQMERPPTHMERTEHMEGPPAHMNRPLGHNMDRPSANMERPPEHMEGPRAHMSLPPGHMERPPAHMDRPPAHMDRPPAHMDRPPTHMDRPPVQMERPPMQMDRSPAHMDRPPVQMDQSPAHIERPPVQMDRPPVQMERPPMQMDRSPAHMDRPPVQMDRSPAHMDRLPAHMDRPPVQMDRPPSHMDRPPMQMDRSPSHEASQPLPPHYLPPHMRQMRPYGMPMPRAPQPDRSNLYGSQYSELHRSALEKQLTAPVSLPQQMPRQAVLAKPSSPGPQEPEKQASRELTPTTAEDEPEPAVDQPQESKEPQLFKLGDDVNRSDEPKLQQIKEEVVSQPREEGSVFGGLVSYFSSQREDDIDA